MTTKKACAQVGCKKLPKIKLNKKASIKGNITNPLNSIKYVFDILASIKDYIHQKLKKGKQ